MENSLWIHIVFNFIRVLVWDLHITRSYDCIECFKKVFRPHASFRCHYFEVGGDGVHWSEQYISESFIEQEVCTALQSY